MLLEILKWGKTGNKTHLWDYGIIQDVFTLQMVTKSKHAMKYIIHCDKVRHARAKQGQFLESAPQNY